MRKISLSVYILSCVHFVLSIAQKWFLCLCVRRDLGVQTSKHWQDNTNFFLVRKIHSWTLIQKLFNRSSLMMRSNWNWFFLLKVETNKKKWNLFRFFSDLRSTLWLWCDQFLAENIKLFKYQRKKNWMNFRRISLVLSVLRFFNKEIFGHLLWIHKTLKQFVSVEKYKTVHQLT